MVYTVNHCQYLHWITASTCTGSLPVPEIGHCQYLHWPLQVPEQCWEVIPAASSLAARPATSCHLKYPLPQDLLSWSGPQPPPQHLYILQLVLQLILEPGVYSESAVLCPCYLLLCGGLGAWGLLWHTAGGTTGQGGRNVQSLQSGLKQQLHFLCS